MQQAIDCPLRIQSGFIGLESYIHAGLILMSIYFVCSFISCGIFWVERVNLFNCIAAIISLFNVRTLFVLLQKRQAIIIEVKEMKT